VAELKPAYLISGADEIRIDAWRTRLRARVKEEGSLATLEVLGGERLSGAEAANAMLSLTLSAGRRYILTDGVERWGETDVKEVEKALAALPPEAVVVLVANGEAPSRLVKTVEKHGGESHVYAGPKPAAYPRWLAERAKDLGFELDGDGAQMLVARVGPNQKRLMRELEKLAVFAGPERSVDLDAVEALASPAVETKAYELADAVVEGDSERALRLAESLQARGEDMMHILFALLRQLRNCHRAWAMVSAGKSVKDIQGALRVPNFVARRLAQQARDVDGERLERALDLLADLDYAIRGAGTLDARSALTVTLAMATSDVVTTRLH
jgi:DNA polymerase-3 subunit delta